MKRKTVTYTGATDDQVRYGGWDDPRGKLTEGKQYELEEVVVGDWRTKVRLVGVDGWFNSAHFDGVCVHD